MPINCHGCLQNCCEDRPILLTVDELVNLTLLKQEKLKGELIGLFFFLDYPCPFLTKVKKCAIYDKRPAMCRKFPSYTEAFGEDVMFGLHPSCPQVPTGDDFGGKEIIAGNALELTGLSSKEFADMLVTFQLHSAKATLMNKAMRGKDQIKFKKWQATHKGEERPMIFIQSMPRRTYERDANKFMRQLIHDGFEDLFKHPVLELYKKPKSKKKKK